MHTWYPYIHILQDLRRVQQIDPILYKQEIDMIICYIDISSIAMEEPLIIQN